MKEKLRTHIEKTINLTDEEFEYVFSHFKIKNLRKHQHIIQEGEYVTKDFWVTQGLLKASYTDQNGKQHIMQFAMENWWISDYQALFNQTKATLHIDCIEDSQVFYVSYQDRIKICNKIHEMANFFRIKASFGYVALQNRILTLLSTNSKERYDLLLLKYPELFQRVPKSLIASFLGVSRETLSRFN